MSPIVINAINVFHHQQKWNSAQIDNYTVEIGYYGLSGLPLQTVVVRDGALVQSTNNFLRDRQDGIPALNLTVDDLFSHAYTCFIYQLCRVEFDEVYGYPSNVGGGFTESGGISARNLQPSKN